MADVVVVGAAGRMGRRLVANVLNTPGMSLAGAVEWSGSEFIGCDAASVAGLPPCGVKITASLPEALEKANAVIDFSTGGTVMENARIAGELGMEPDKVLRLSQVTGLAEMFTDKEFSEAWEPAEGDLFNDNKKNEK